jgi:hypothetical protein
VLHVACFQGLVDLRLGEGCVGAEHTTRRIDGFGPGDQLTIECGQTGEVVGLRQQLTDYLDLLGEERLNFLTAGRGPSLWLMDIGAQYYLNDYFAIFGAIGTSVAGTSAVAPPYLTTIIGTDINLPMRW